MLSYGIALLRSVRPILKSKGVLHVFYQCTWDEGGRRNIKRHTVSNRNSKAWHLPDLLHYLQLPLLSLNYLLGKVWIRQPVLWQ